MTDSVSKTIPGEATHLMVLDSLATAVAIHDLAAEKPRGIYVPKGDALWYAINDERIFVARPDIDDDLTVDLVYAPPTEAYDTVAEGKRIFEQQRTEPAKSILAFFEFEHLTNPGLREISASFHNMAIEMNNTLPNGPEKSAGLRKLLEAKDCFVRAAL